MRIILRSLMLALTFLVLLTGCEEQGAPPVATQQLPTIVPGTAQVVGRAVRQENGQALGDISIWLAPVFTGPDGRKIYAIDMGASPVVKTKPDGTFVFESLEAREYVLVVGPADGAHFVPKDDQGNAIVHDAKADQVLDLGTIRAIGLN